MSDDGLITQALQPASLPTGTNVATRSVMYSGLANMHIAPVGLVGFSGADDAKVAHDIPGDETNGLAVDVRRLATGVSPDIGATTDVEAVGIGNAAGSVIGLLKRVRTLLLSVIAALAPSETITAGTLTLSTTPTPIGSSLACKEVTIQAPASNTQNVLLGDATTQPLVLLPGDILVIPVSNRSLVFVKAAAGTPVINTLARS